ncbi:MAG TPA: hypothetical protein VKO67_08895 [Smithellaceae bacterium]|nr:hypothetical protein [Smithellaceae bacterium]
MKWNLKGREPGIKRVLMFAVEFEQSGRLSGILIFLRSLTGIYAEENEIFIAESRDVCNSAVIVVEPFLPEVKFSD